MPDAQEQKPRSPLPFVTNNPIWQALAAAADLITVGGMAIVVGALIVGAVGNQITAALAFALAASILVNVYLVFRHVPRKITEARATVAATIKKAIDEVYIGERPDEPSKWLPDKTNPATLALTNANLEGAYERASLLAHDHLGDDARVRFSNIRITIDRGISIVFYADSYTSQKGMHIYVTDDRATSSGPSRSTVTKQQPEPWDRPWRTDDKWRELLRKSWLRISPFKGVVEISHGIRIPNDHADLAYVLWTVTYKREAGDYESRPLYAVMTVDGELIVHGGP